MADFGRFRSAIPKRRYSDDSKVHCSTATLTLSSLRNSYSCGFIATARHSCLFIIFATCNEIDVYGIYASKLQKRVCCSKEAGAVGSGNQSARRSRACCCNGDSRSGRSTTTVTKTDYKSNRQQRLIVHCPTMYTCRIHLNSLAKNRGTDRLGRVKCGWNVGTEPLCLSLNGPTAPRSPYSGWRRFWQPELTVVLAR